MINSIVFVFKNLIKNKFLFVFLVICIAINSFLLLYVTETIKDNIYPSNIYAEDLMSNVLIFEEDYSVEQITNSASELDYLQLYFIVDNELKIYHAKEKIEKKINGSGFTSNERNEIILPQNSDYKIGEKLSIEDVEYLVVGKNVFDDYALINNYAFANRAVEGIKVVYKELPNNRQLKKIDKILSGFNAKIVSNPIKINLFKEIISNYLYLFLIIICAFAFITVNFCIYLMTDNIFSVFKTMKLVGFGNRLYFTEYVALSTISLICASVACAFHCILSRFFLDTILVKLNFSEYIMALLFIVILCSFSGITNLKLKFRRKIV